MSDNVEKCFETNIYIYIYIYIKDSKAEKNWKSSYISGHFK